jgi:paraquat-inducible protein B
MSRPRKQPNDPPSQEPLIQISGSTLESVLETVLARCLQPLQTDLSVVSDKIQQMEQKTQHLTETLQPLPQTLTDILNQWLKQLQTILNNGNSDNTSEILREQLRQLIAALSRWNQQLQTELTLQQRLIDSIRQLETRLNEYSPVPTESQEDPDEIEQN